MGQGKEGSLKRSVKLPGKKRAVFGWQLEEVDAHLA